jgi:hypothetical protein
MTINNISDPNDCGFLEKITSEFERLSSSFDDGTNLSQSELPLLNKNTKLLNDEINKFRSNRFTSLLKQPLSSNVKNDFEKTYIPTSIRDAFRRREFANLEDIANYAIKTNELQSEFPTIERVIERIGNLAPNVYQTFESQYPAVSERLRYGPISSAEVNRLTTQYGINSTNFADRVRTSVSEFLGLLQRLLSGMGLGLGLMGSFCSLIDNVYGVVNGVRDSLGNTASFAGNLSGVISAISPRINEMLETVQEIRGLVQNVRDSSSTMQSSMRDAFSLIASAMNIAIRFFDSSTGESGSVEIDWDFVGIKGAIEDAINDIQSAKDLFIEAQVENGRSLADFNNDGTVDQDDLIILQEYIDETLQDTVVIDYIEKKMLPFMVSEIRLYKDYTEYASTTNTNVVDISGAVESFSTASQLFGTPSAPSGGDFGLSQLSNILSSLGNIEGQIRGFVGDLQRGRPINIDTILGQIREMRSLASQSSNSIFSDMRSTMGELQRTVEQTLNVAERLSVSNPTRTREIQESRTESIGENVTRALNLSARATSEIVPILNQRLSGLDGLLRNAGAVGVLNTVEERLTTVVEQSARQLETIARTYSPTSLDNGFNFNIQSTFARFASLQARALGATSDDSIRHVQNVVRGNLARNVSGFRNPSRRDVEFVALRACNLAGELERIYNDLAGPLQQMINQFQETNTRLASVGADVSSAAVRAGAIRLPSSARPAAATSAANIPTTVATPFIDPASGSRTTVPPVDSLSSPGYGPVPIIPSEYGNLPNFEQLKNNQVWNGLFRFGGGMSSSRNNWDPILELPEGVQMLRKFLNFANTWRQQGGSPLVIISAFRRGARTPGGRISEHSLGKALDIESSGRTNQIRMMNIAYNAGFRGFGSYNMYGGFVHIDTASGSWGVFRYYNLPGANGNKTG